LGFCDTDRSENIRRIAHVANLSELGSDYEVPLTAETTIDTSQVSIHAAIE